MTTREAAALLNLKPDTVRRQCKRGRFPGARLVMRDWDIPAESVEAYRRDHRGQPGLRHGAKLGPRLSTHPLPAHRSPCWGRKRS